MNKKLVSTICFVLGVVFIVLAVVYFITPAKALPSFLPGYTAGLVKTHYKHGIGSLFVGLVLFAIGWFQSGKKSEKRQEKSEKTTE